MSGADRVPLLVVVVGIALNIPGWIWHEFVHSHEGLETLRTQAVFYLATALVLVGAIMALSRGLARPLHTTYAVVLSGALIQGVGWVWDFIAHYQAVDSTVAHAIVYAGSAIIVAAISWRLTMLRRHGGIEARR